MQRLPNVRLVPVDAELTGLGVRVAAGLRLRGGDALYVALTQRLGVPLVTWDEEQRERGSEVVMAITPQQVLKE
jgi:predicted nucleic acid-binding protein